MTTPNERRTFQHAGPQSAKGYPKERKRGGEKRRGYHRSSDSACFLLSCAIAVEVRRRERGKEREDWALSSSDCSHSYSPSMPIVW